MSNMSGLKQIRGQLRQIVKEELTEILKSEAHKAIMFNIERELERRFKFMEDRQKDVINMIIRNSAK